MLARKLNLGFLAIAISLIACSSEEPTKQLAENRIPVKVAATKLVALGDQISYSGTVLPIERVRLSTKIMGWLEKQPFAEGEQFSTGDLLIKLRSKDLEAKLAQTKAAVDEATIHFQNAQTNLNRIEALFNEKAASQKELEDIRAAFSSAKARKISAEKTQAQVEELLRYSSILAPFKGAVARKMLEVGDMANPGQPVLEIENTARVKIVAKVPEKDVQNLKTGTPVSVSIEALVSASNGKSPKSQIKRIVPAADPKTRQFEIHVELDNASGDIKSGMFARITLSKSGREGLLVPQNSIVRRGQLEGVFVIDKNKFARLRWIRTGAKWQESIEVLAGLTAADKVIVQPASTLLDGQAVEVVQ